MRTIRTLKYKLAQEEMLEDISYLEGDGFFEPDAFMTGNPGGYKSRNIVIHMHPKDFIDLIEEGEDLSKEDTVRSLMESDVLFNTLPFISFVHDGMGTATVIAHEGRHRAHYFLSKGITSMPVLFNSESGGGGEAIRWDRQSEIGFEQIRGEWPMVLREQEGLIEKPFPIFDLRNK
tara:strand:- start:811 stop:1338 length:528 start_codon:yes stop_codon:yes gene_type:complete